MKRVAAVTIAVVQLAAGAARSQEPPGAAPKPGRPRVVVNEPPDDPLARFLFPPDLVMQQEFAIGLKPEQRGAITQAIQQFQGNVVELQWQMHEETQRLTELLDKTVVDQAAALAQIDKVLAVERGVKRAHIGLLIQIKNQLTAEQQARLAQARPAGTP
ncbi:MAG TPA: periplasmic heavy metal sensor [Gemmatimonadales bacterium]|nr:periplasmic heavy metal sensor [Gemmatimonadales bacterium]